MRHNRFNLGSTGRFFACRKLLFLGNKPMDSNQITRLNVSFSWLQFRQIAPTAFYHYTVEPFSFGRSKYYFQIVHYGASLRIFRQSFCSSSKSRNFAWWVSSRTEFGSRARNVNATVVLFVWCMLENCNFSPNNEYCSVLLTFSYV